MGDTPNKPKRVITTIQVGDEVIIRYDTSFSEANSVSPKDFAIFKQFGTQSMERINVEDYEKVISDLDMLTKAARILIDHDK